MASSPDEKAILEWCRDQVCRVTMMMMMMIMIDDDDDGDQGFVYEGETAEGRVTVAARGISHTYTKLAELAFDSYRKCMSVIVKVTFTPLSQPS